MNGITATIRADLLETGDHVTGRGTITWISSGWTAIHIGFTDGTLASYRAGEEVQVD